MQCCAVYQRKSHEIIFFKECSPLEVDEQKKNLNEILIYVNDFKFLNQKQIQKIHTHAGVWYISLDSRNCCHLVYCEKSYPEKSALRFLSQMKRLICGVNQYDQNPQNIEKFLSHRLYNLIKGYNADINYDDDYQYSEKSVHSVIVDIQDINSSPARASAHPKNAQINESINHGMQSIKSTATFYPKPTTSNQFPEYICYGTLLLVSFLMLVLIIIKIG